MSIISGHAHTNWKRNLNRAFMAKNRVVLSAYILAIPNYSESKCIAAGIFFKGRDFVAECIT